MNTKEENITKSIHSGLKSAFITGSISGLGVYTANKFSPTFRKSVGISGKTGLIVMPIMGMYFLETELNINKYARNDESSSESSSRTSSLDKFGLFAGLSIPIIGYTFYRQFSNKAIKHNSIKLLQTRVLAQGGLIGLFCAIEGSSTFSKIFN